MNHDHNKIKVDNLVIFKDNWDDEIQCGNWQRGILDGTQVDWKWPKQQSFIFLLVFPLQLSVLI